jgi:hypothetical protein
MNIFRYLPFVTVSTLLCSPVWASGDPPVLPKIYVGWWVTNASSTDYKLYNNTNYPALPGYTYTIENISKGRHPEFDKKVAGDVSGSGRAREVKIQISKKAEGETSFTPVGSAINLNTGSGFRVSTDWTCPTNQLVAYKIERWLHDAKNPDSRPYLWTVHLLPIELRDIKDHANTGDDVVISHWTTGQTITDANIAWIEAHKSATDDTPRMPQLVFNIPGFPQGVTLEAKLLVEYVRPYAGKQADDTVKIPANGSFKSITNGRWELWNEYSDLPFFGGDATLTYKINGGEEQTIKFAIGGRNPDDSRCKAYTQGRPGAPWHAYAIEKHESRSYNPGFYNQFWERSGNSSPINSGINYTFTKGDPLVVRSNGETGVGGAGLAQVTGANGVKTVSAPREIFWNWQKNVDSFLSILAGKIQVAETFMNDPTPRSGPGSMPNGQRPQTTFHTGQNVPVPSRVQGPVTFGDSQGQKRPEDAVAIKAYNGAAAHWCSWRGPTVHEWQFNYGQNNYVEEVCNQVEGAQP